MSTRWERLAGDTGAFALKLAFARDPDDGQVANPRLGRGLADVVDAPARGGTTP